MSLENTLVNMERTQAFIIDFGMALQMPTDAHGQRCDNSVDTFIPIPLLLYCRRHGTPVCI